MCDLYEIWDINFNYYHYQPGSNIINVYCKHITHARAQARRRARMHTAVAVQVLVIDGSVAPNSDGVNAPFRRFRWRSMASRCFIQINSRVGDSVFEIVLGVFRVSKNF